MSEVEGLSDHVDNWVFDSLVNFLHGSIWKVPVVGFIEEKSVVFDPDSYNNMTEEKEEEFRKIHEEYKGVVDFMLTSFMEDLQVSPEQVEDACRVREHQNKTLPESHITKVALEQLWAAEDFTSFRRLMTRKNIDLQLQSLELLVAKYGVLSPALRSGDSEDHAGEDGEDDFLQVVIRYSDQLETFKCDYGSEAPNPGVSYRNNGEVPTSDSSSSNMHTNYHDGLNAQCDKNMPVHLAGISFKNSALAPVHYQATLTSSSASSSAANIHDLSSPTRQKSPENSKGDHDAGESSLNGSQAGCEILSCVDQTYNLPTVEPNAELIKTEPESSHQDLSVIPPNPTPTPTPPPSPSPPNENVDSIAIYGESHIDPIATDNEPIVRENVKIEKILKIEALPELPVTVPEIEEDRGESQLIQLEEAEAAMDGESTVKALGDPTPPKEKKGPPPSTLGPLKASPHFDEKTVADIASSAPEQRRLLTAVRKALEVTPDDSEPVASIDMPTSAENDDDLQKRREYLRAQRDKLVAMKKQEREKLLLENSSTASGSSARPKSARAAQIALKNPNNMRAASLSEKSLSARRALADRLKQELIEK